MDVMFLTVIFLSFIAGFLLGRILEKRKCQKKIAQIFNEAVDEIYKVREVDK